MNDLAPFPPLACLGPKPKDLSLSLLHACEGRLSRALAHRSAIYDPTKTIPTGYIGKIQGIS